MTDSVMPRQTPPDRLEKILAVAATAFVEHGFHRTQMDDIALALDVSKGTVYRSVESKEALLVAVTSPPRVAVVSTIAVWVGLATVGGSMISKVF